MLRSPEFLLDNLRSGTLLLVGATHNVEYLLELIRRTPASARVMQSSSQAPGVLPGGGGRGR